MVNSRFPKYRLGLNEKAPLKNEAGHLLEPGQIRHLRIERGAFAHGAFMLEKKARVARRLPNLRRQSRDPR